MGEKLRCWRCGAVFGYHEADAERIKEDLNGEGAWEVYETLYCPLCGAENPDDYWETEPEDTNNYEEDYK